MKSKVISLIAYDPVERSTFEKDADREYVSDRLIQSGLIKREGRTLFDGDDPHENAVKLIVEAFTLPQRRFIANELHEVWGASRSVEVRLDDEVVIFGPHVNMPTDWLWKSVFATL